MVSSWEGLVDSPLLVVEISFWILVFIVSASSSVVAIDVVVEGN